MIATRSVAVVAILIATSWAALLREQPNPERTEGHCKPITYQTGEIKSGDSKNVEGHCLSANCLDDGGVVYYTCGVSSVPKHCRMTEEDLTQTYPHCCPRVICEDLV